MASLEIEVFERQYKSGQFNDILADLKKPNKKKKKEVVKKVSLIEPEAEGIRRQGMKIICQCGESYQFTCDWRIAYKNKGGLVYDKVTKANQPIFDKLIEEGRLLDEVFTDVPVLVCRECEL